MSSDVLGLINRLGEKERRITDLEFVSPVFYNPLVTTRIDGIINTFSIPKTAPGWYKMRPVNLKTAKITGEADYVEREKYLKFLGKLRVVLTLKKNNVYLAIPDKMNKYKLPFQEFVPVCLFDDTVLDFDRAIVRYDGANFWFESLDIANDPAKAEYLRESVEKLIEPEKIKFKGLVFEEKLAYTLRTALDRKFIEENKKHTIQKDVEFAGGQFVRFIEKSDHYSVTYKVNGEEFTSHVSRDPNHRVVAAGICLNGNDSNFDLKSLITVVREAQNKRVIHKFHID